LRRTDIFQYLSLSAGLLINLNMLAISRGLQLVSQNTNRKVAWGVSSKGSFSTVSSSTKGWRSSSFPGIISSAASAAFGSTLHTSSVLFQLTQFNFNNSASFASKVAPAKTAAAKKQPAPPKAKPASPAAKPKPASAASKEKERSKLTKDKEADRQKQEKERERERERKEREKEKERDQREKEKAKQLAQKERERTQKQKDAEKLQKEKEKAKAAKLKAQDAEREAKLKEKEREKKLKEKDANKPKRSRNAYSYFVAEMVPKLKEKYADEQMQGILQRASQQWKETSDVQKKTYVAKAEESRTVYKKEMEKYKASLPPKRPLSAYFLFANDVRERLKKADPDGGVAVVAKAAGKEWQGMSPEQKKPYEAKAQKLKEEWEKKTKASKPAAPAAPAKAGKK